MSLGSHQRTIGASQVHITPKHILDALGEFDLDPAAATVRPWDCAIVNWTVEDDGLAKEWPAHWRVFLNPPFDRRVVGQWIAKLAAHGRGIALLHARTETVWFQPIWDHAEGILFLGHRIIFCKPDGTLCTTKKGDVANSGAPPILVAFGEAEGNVLRNCGLAGKYLPVNPAAARAA
jgi:hypothetical protein